MSHNTSQTDAPVYQKRSRSKRAWGIATVLLVVAALIAAAVLWFNRDTTAPGGGSGNSGGGDTSRGELTVGLTLEPTNLDIRNTGGVALDQILVDNIYQGLIGLKSGTVDEFVPVLAEAMPTVAPAPESGPNAISHTFTLRDGVTFESGNKLTSQDVADSIAASELAETVTVNTPDERTVELIIAEPNSQFFWLLATRPGLVFESAFTGDLSGTTNGTGPYTLEEWKQSDSITFAAREDYWGEAATLDRVVWRYIADGNAAVNATLEGDVDVLAPVTENLAAKFEGSQFRLINADGTDVYTLAYNNQRAPLNDVRVRTALSKAIDNEAIVAAFFGAGKQLGGPITTLEPGYADLSNINSYDPEGAKELLSEAGVSDLSLTVSFPNFYPQDAINQVVTQFAAIGVELKVDVIEFGTWLSDVYTDKNYDLSYIDHAEASDFANYANPDYYFGYDNAEVQALYARSLAAENAADADALLQQAAEIVANDAPAKWLINWTPTVAISPEVTGFPESNINSRINLAGVRVQ